MTETQDTATTNRFADAETLETVIGEAIGAGSTCWEHTDRAGVFDSTQARAIVDEALARLRELPLWAADKPKHFDMTVHVKLAGEPHEVKVGVAYEDPRGAVAALYQVVNGPGMLAQIADMIGGLPGGLELAHDDADDVEPVDLDPFT